MAADGNPEVNLEMGNHPNGGEEGQRVEVQDVDDRVMGFVERLIFLWAELYADEENDSTEIKGRKRMTRAALTMWKEDIESSDNRLLQCKSESRSIMNEVYNLVSLYSVFVGVVLTAVVTSSRMECQHLWSPVGLSLFAYFMVVVVAFTKFREIQDLRVKIATTECHLRGTWLRVEKLKVHGYAGFDFDRHCGEIQYRRVPKGPLWRNALGLIVPLTIFTTGLVFSLVHILCWS